MIHPLEEMARAVDPAALQSPASQAAVLNATRVLRQKLRGVNWPTGYQLIGLGYGALANDRMIIGDPQGLGKQQPVDTRVLTPTGWMCIGDLRPGYAITRSDGRAARVTAIFPQGVKPAYRVYFNDGSSVEAGPEHLWTVLYRRGGGHGDYAPLLLTTQALMDLPLVPGARAGTTLDLAKTPLYLPLLSAPVKFAAQAPLPLDPYQLGQLIANGCLHLGTPKLTTGTHNWPCVRRVLLARGVPVEGERTYGSVVQLNFRGITKTIRALDLAHPSGAKRIPIMYLMAPVADRIALFQGLMDGDGTISATGNKLGYCSTNRELAQDVRGLIESLGGIATLHAYDRSHENKPTDYLVSMRLPAGIVPFNVESRARRYVPSKRTHPSRRVERVEYSRDVESVCIQVDAPDQLYVTEHCILTHNTAISLCRILVADLYPAVVIAPASAARPVWFEQQLPMWLPDVPKHLVDSTHAWIPPAGWRGVVVTTWDLLRYHSTGLHALRPKIVIADECFPAGTPVETAYGPCPIEQIRVGTPVLCVDAAGHLRVRPVLRVMPKPQQERLCRVVHGSGVLVCTQRHKVWTTERGYVEAQSIRPGETLCALSLSRGLRHNVHCAAAQRAGPRQAVLFRRLLRPLALSHGQSDESGAHTAKGNSRDARSNVSGSRREWQDDARTRSRCDCVGIADGVSHSNGAGETAVSVAAAVLQSRRGVAGTLVSDRNRRANAQNQALAVSRRAEDCRVVCARVESVEILERGGANRLTHGVGEDSTVYDLEVEEHHNYFAAGVRVSNCHNALSTEAQRTQHLRVLIDRVPHLHLMSGTPIVNRSQDLYQLLHLLDPKAWPEETLSLFRELNREDFDRGVQTRLTRRISQFMLRRDKAEALPHLKVKQQSLIHIDLDPTVLAAYKRIEHSFATWLERQVRLTLTRERPDLGGEELEAEVDQRCLASLKAENLTRFGYLCRRVGMAKVPAAVAWIRAAVRAQEPVVVFTRHTDVLQAIVLALRQHGVRVSVVDGSVSPRRRGKTVRDFQEGRTDVFVASLAAKEALTLTRARHVLFAERWLTFAAEDQGADRIHRLGQLRDCFVWQLVARHTIDERVDTLVSRKKRITRRTVDGGKPQGVARRVATTA